MNNVDSNFFGTTMQHVVHFYSGMLAYTISTGQRCLNQNCIKVWPVAKPAREFSHAMQIFSCLQTVKTMNF